MSRVSTRAKQAIFIALAVSAVLFPTAFSGGGEASILATAPDLGTAKSFAVLAGQTVTNTGPTSVIGDLGVWPGTAITGFPPGIVTGGTIHAGDAVAMQAQSGVTAAYNVLTSQACTSNLTSPELGGLTLTPGVYCFTSSAQLTGTLTLNAQGDPNAVFIFKIVSTLTTANASSVLVINGGNDCNVFWQVGSSATLGTDTSFKGNILALTSITLNTGASVVSGRALARNGAVTMDDNTVSIAGCAVSAATPTPTSTATVVSTFTPIPTATPVSATLTPIPPTSTAVAATATSVAAATATAVAATSTAVAATSTAVAATSTAAAATATSVAAATATSMAATATSVAAATSTAVAATPTAVAATPTTVAAATSTGTPTTAAATPTATNTPKPTTPTRKPTATATSPSVPRAPATATAVPIPTTIPATGAGGTAPYVYSSANQGKLDQSPFARGTSQGAANVPSQNAPVSLPRSGGASGNSGSPLAPLCLLAVAAVGIGRLLTKRLKR